MRICGATAGEQQQRQQQRQRQQRQQRRFRPMGNNGARRADSCTTHVTQSDQSHGGRRVAGSGGRSSYWSRCTGGPATPVKLGGRDRASLLNPLGLPRRHSPALSTLHPISPPDLPYLSCEITAYGHNRSRADACCFTLS
ncbi:hypothetical protein SRHO_G00108190 [Serrasalmus rhombeus]